MTTTKRHHPVRPARCALLAVLVAACGGEPTPPPGMEPFVAVYAELRLAERDAASPADFEARKAEILARHRTSEAELEAFLEEHGRDVALMAQVWDSVQARLEASTAEPPSPEEAR